MSSKTLTTILAAAFLLIAAEPAATQQRGTIEFGAFGTYAGFDEALRTEDTFGGGLRVGAFIFPRLSVEFDIVQKYDAGRPSGLQSVDAEAFAWRLTAIPLKFGSVSTLVGLGLSHTDIQNDVHESEGFHALLGAKLPLSSSVDLRVEGVSDWNGDGIRNQAVNFGLSLYRHPKKKQAAPAAAAPQRPDSVSAAETRRLREIERRYRALRDSLAAGMTLSAAERATLIQTIHFEHDRSALSDTAKSILRAKVSVFKANPELRIVMTGYASRPAAQDYNLALGLERARAARDYLVSQGVTRSRIEIVTRGEEDQLVVEGPADVVEAANRRAEFRVLIAEPGAQQD